MVGDTDSVSGSSSSSSEDKAQAAFSLVKYENPEVIDKEDPEDGDGDAESCEEILNSILPPREWEHSGKLWRQRVSASPATRLDVMNLQEQLDQKLQQRQARETGICQVKMTTRELNQIKSQCSGSTWAVFSVFWRTHSSVNHQLRGAGAADAPGPGRAADDAPGLPDSLRVQHRLRDQESSQGRGGEGRDGVLYQQAWAGEG